MDLALCYENVIPSRGGAERYVGELTARLVRDGHAVHIYASRWDAAALPAVVHFHRIPTIRGPRFLRPWRFAVAVNEALTGHRHDTIIGFDKIYGMDVVYPLGGLQAGTIDGNLRKTAALWKRRIARSIRMIDPATRSFLAIERRMYSGPNPPKILANSRMIQGDFERYLQIPPSQVEVVPHGVDPARFAVEDRPRRRFDERRRLALSETGAVGLFIGHNFALKGLPQAIRALPLCPELSLVVVGKGKTWPMEKLARELGVADRVRFAGASGDPRNFFFAADFLVHPTFYDPCSLVLLEALACGLPVLTSRYNGAAELMENGREGFVISDPHNRDELAAAMNRLADGPTRAACAQAARLRAKNWTFETHYQLLLASLKGAAALKQAA